MGRGEIIASLRAYLELLRDTGVDELPRTRESMPLSRRGASKPLPTPPPKPAQISVTDRPAPVASGETLEQVRADLVDCHRCSLGDLRTSLVFGVGNPHAPVIFVGEAPGRDEDLQGEPFVGEAGQLLTKIIQAMGFSRDEVYICNVLKCRPPDNRDPLPAEVATCGPFLLRQIKAVGPRAIVALGKFAAQTLLGTKESITSLRGRFHDYHGIPLMPTFHPSAMLRDPAKKRPVWEDMQQVMALLGKEPPKRQH